MTKDEALKLALEALQHEADTGNDDAYKLERDAIKEALAQPEQETLAWRWPYKFKDIGETGGYEYHSHEFACLAHLPKGEPLYTHPPVPTEQAKEPEQEPVTWRYKIVDVFGRPVWTLKTPKSDTRVLESQPLYTTPPQRTWVGLTPQERDEINEKVYGAVPHHVAFHAAIEAKLKEKNT